MKNAILLSCLLLFVFLANQLAVSQQRPKVGLVLSGGGAKGMAHIGILKAIDKAGLKVDYITGTSMGSIMAAMYAAGYSGEEIEKISASLDWAVILGGKPPYHAVSLDEKDEYDNYSLQVPFDGLKPAFSTGLIESEEIWLKFSEILFPVHNVKDFSKLNIPFKCIATDLQTGKAVVIDKGELVWAIRSSMAIPSVFSAVPYKDTKLVDGGIVRNFPVKDLKEMGADYVIGVNLFPGLAKTEDLNTMIDVQYQIVNYRDADDLEKQKKLCDKLIEPATSMYSAGSFSDSEEIIKIGNELGDELYPYFKHLADSLNAIEKVEFNPINRLPKVEDVIIDDFSIQGLENTSETMLMQSLNIEKGKSYTPNMLNESFRRAYATLYYQYLYYELIPTTSGHCTLKCVVLEAELNQLKLGYSYHSFTGGALITNFTMRNLLFDKSRTYIKAAIGENMRLKMVHRQAFGNKLNNFIELNGSIDNIDIPLYVGSDIESYYDSKFYKVGLEYYRLFNKNWGASIGLMREMSFYHPNTIGDPINYGEYKKNVAYVGAYHNSLNRRFLPTTGNQINIKLAMLGNRDYYAEKNDGSIVDHLENELQSRLFFNGNFHQQTNKRVSFYQDVDLGYIQNSSNTLVDQFLIGGIQRLAPMHVGFVGLNDVQLHSNSIANLGAGFQYKLIGEFYTVLRANIATYGWENPFTNAGWNNAQFISGFGASLAYNLSALPFNFTMMYSPEIDDVYTHVNIGFVF